jgi:uncharacterized protein
LPAATSRIAALDLVRGIAVLGILTINIAAFAGGASAVLGPHIPQPGTFADELAFAAGLVLFEGKMRGLFTLLFGASLLLLLDRREAAGLDGKGWQTRRLGWLLLIGYCHQLFLWSGDILMLYAMIAPIALAMRHLPVRTQVIAALLLFAAWHALFALTGWSSLAAAEAAYRGTASADQLAALAQASRSVANESAVDLELLRQPYLAMLGDRLLETIYMPLLMAVVAFGETLPLMLLGMALYRSGCFTGSWNQARLWRLAALGIGLGLPLAMAQTWWAWTRSFPPEAMFFLATGFGGPQHLLLTLAWAALLMLAAPALLRMRIGQWLAAAGRMALSNYLMTSVTMAFCFYGWGLGLIGTVGPARQWLFVLLGWAVMLGFSRLWLARCRQGPAEWVWRSLTERRPLPLKQ